MTASSELAQAFQKFDADGKGWFSRSELGSILQAIQTEHVTDKAISKVVEQADVNGDGKIDYHEFSEWMMAAGASEKSAILQIFDGVDAGDLQEVQSGFEQLVQKKGKKAALKLIQSNDHDDERNSRSVLHLAASRGRAQILGYLLENNADPSAIDDKGDTLLHLATQSARARVVRCLLEAGADQKAKNNFSRSPESLAGPQSWDSSEVASAKEHIRKMFEGTFGSWDDLPLEPLAKQHTTTLRNENSNSVAVPTAQQENGLSQDSATVTPSPTALKDRADAQSPEKLAGPATSHSDLDDYEFVKTVSMKDLVRQGDIAAVKRWVGASKAHQEMLQGGSTQKEKLYYALTNCDGDEDGDTRSVTSVLHLAVMRGNMEILQALLETRVDPNTDNDQGNTCLHLAAQSEKSEVIQLLLDMNADPNIHNNFGRSALQAEDRDRFHVQREEPGDIVSDEDLATCVRVLEAYATREGGISEAYKAPRCTPLRKAMMLYLDDMRGGNA